jgi:hypothetical protein
MIKIFFPILSGLDRTGNIYLVIGDLSKKIAKGAWNSG